MDWASRLVNCARWQKLVCSPATQSSRRCKGTLIGLVANFKDIGTWIGEAAAKLAGYKDRTDELARADKLAADIAKEAAADKARLAAAIQAAIDFKICIITGGAGVGKTTVINSIVKCLKHRE